MALLELCCTRWFFIRVLALSGLLTLLQLSTSLYMLVVYDRVLPSGSVMTLAGLTGLTAALHGAFAGLDAIRARMVCRAGLLFMEDLDRRLLSAFAARSARVAGHRLHQVRRTRYVLAWDLHAGRAGTERRDRWQDAAQSWDTLSRRYAETTRNTAERAHIIEAFGKGLRLSLQSAGLGLGALLALEDLLSAGGLIASSLVLARTFACLDGALAHWGAFRAAREGCQRLLLVCGETPSTAASRG